MKPFKPIGNLEYKTTLDELTWIPEDMKKSLSRIVSFLINFFKTDISQIGLYGSWQRDNAGPESDVDIVVFLTYEVSWFDVENGITNRSDAHKDKLYWHAIEKKANACRLDSRVYSIAIVTPGMLEYYATQGPIHLQNWVYALRNCHSLWKS
jgi:predicted nucleotidyltransferase